MSRCYWITGLSGAGKTTTARALGELLKGSNVPYVVLDGDEIREVLGEIGKGYSMEERLRLAYRYARLSKLITDQGVAVICATISMFHEVRSWNRDNIMDYREVYLRADLKLLQSRDTKGVYYVDDSVVDNVLGLNTDFEEPETADLVFEMGSGIESREIAKEIFCANG